MEQMTDVNEIFIGLTRYMEQWFVDVIILSICPSKGS